MTEWQTPLAGIPLWRKIQRTNFTDIEELIEYLELSDDLKKEILLRSKFPLNLPRRLAAKIKKNTLDDPVLRQFVPLQSEAYVVDGFVKEPLQEGQQSRVTKKLLKKYEGRALLVTSGACGMHCRYCFRQNFSYAAETFGFDEEIAYLMQDASISELILSGGDPLSLSNPVLTQLFQAFSGISHLRRIRFHTRFPIGIPERIDESFLQLLKSSKKQIFFTIHCNHPNELDCEILCSLKKIQSLGIPVLNQSVLLKGVNDQPEVLLSLCEMLINAGIVPYYLHELDPVEGASHFAVLASRGIALIQYVQEQLSGFGVPRLVREIPNRSSKTFVSSDF